jgi:hypothetical protein
MSTTTKHEFHPDAESLSAFAEQALSDRERGQVLEHLAACGRCRQVVALAREAAHADLATPATARRAAIQPDSWWKKWRLVWVPTAVVAAFAAASISVYVHQADRSGASIKIAEQATTQNEPVAASSAPPKPEVVPPSSPGPVAPETKVRKPAPLGAPPAPPSRHVAAPAPMPPPPDAFVQANAAREEPMPAPAPEENRFSSKRVAPARASTVSSAAPAAPAMQDSQEELDRRMRQEEERQQARVAERPMLPASAAPSSAPVAESGAPGSQNADVSVSNPQLVARSNSLASFGSMKSSHDMAKTAAGGAGINLPSGQPAVSTAANGHRMLAIDKAGVLFLSLDAGNTWERVHRQWTGRAVTVRTHPNPDAAAPSATEQAGADRGAAGQVPAFPAFFEILNDKDQVWLSTDGRQWIAN